MTMFNHTRNQKQESYNICVVKKIVVDSLNQQNPAARLEVIVAAYRTGIKEFAYIPLNQAQMDLARLGNGHYIATDNPEIAEKYKIKLMKRF